MLGEACDVNGSWQLMKRPPRIQALMDGMRQGHGKVPALAKRAYAREQIGQISRPVMERGAESFVVAISLTNSAPDIHVAPRVSVALTLRRT